MSRVKSRPSRDANFLVRDDNLTPLICNWISTLRSHPEKRFAYLAEVGLSKFVSSETDPADVRADRAISKWLYQEDVNSSTEDRLLLTDPGYHILPRVTYERFLRKCQAVILELLGDTVPCEALFGGFSGGSSTSRKRTESQPCSKFAGKAHITQSATKWWSVVLTEAKLLWRRGSPGLKRPTVVSGNVMFTVPKSTSIDRVACKEPDLNMFLQKGAGLFIRKQLRRCGINLNDQTRNQRLAREGSRTGRLATIDLSSASDSVTVELCRQTLPPLWFAYLMDIRSPVTRLPDGTEHVNTMISSMGNGFTFELESLLFYALARTTSYFLGSREVISVYGDDIIIASDIAQDFTDVLHYFGFRVNPEKSFWTGTFRESCGGHYDGGCDISPFYLRSPITRLTDVIRTANALRKWGDLDNLGVCDPRIEHLWGILASFVPKSLWGGDNLSSDTQLVAPRFTPRKRLLKVTKGYDPSGSYLYWHQLVDGVRGSRDDAIVTSEPSTALEQYKLVSVKISGTDRSAVPWLPSELPAEMNPVMGPVRM